MLFFKWLFTDLHVHTEWYTSVLEGWKAVANEITRKWFGNFSDGGSYLRAADRPPRKFRSNPGSSAYGKPGHATGGATSLA